MFGIGLDLGDEARDSLVSLTRAAAAAEWGQWNELLTVAEDLSAQVDEEREYFRRMVLRSAIPVTIGQIVGLSEGQVCSRLAVAERVRKHCPRTWAAFQDGLVDGSRVRLFSGAIEKLKEADSRKRLDHLGLDYARTHTVTELKLWLRRFIARMEPEGFNARADEERRRREVKVTFGDDGMGWLEAYLPNYLLAAIDNRLDAAAKNLATDPGDERSHTQRRADLFAQWLLSSQHAPANLKIDVGVTIPVTALTGSSGQSTQSAVGWWGIPSGWAMDEFMKSDVFWHRMVIDPVTDDVLAHDYVGRFAPDIVRRALLFKYKTCQGPGCCKPADKCEIDHRIPWPRGKTTGSNLWPLCKASHSLKGHGILVVA